MEPVVENKRTVRQLRKLARVALVGRRNVGKSTLLNALYGRRRAITDEYAGLTRDILEVEVHRPPYHFMLSDTPGLDITDPGSLEEQILERAYDHMRSMDLILHVFEAPTLAPFDFDFIELVRKSADKPVVHVVNKVDGEEHATEALTEFFEAGISEPIPVSARGRWNLGELLARMAKELPGIVRAEDTPVEEEDDSSAISDTYADQTRIAIVGRPNAGKSSIFNRLLQKDVAVVSEVAGTTRDTIDTLLAYEGKTIRVIDTAGLRRAGKVARNKDGSVEFYSATRTKRAIKDANVIIHVIDAQIGLTDFDKRISQLIGESGRPCVIAVNKWDLVPGKETHSARDFEDRIRALFPHAGHLPFVFCSAITGQRLPRLLTLSCELVERSNTRVGTRKLNQDLARWMHRLPGTGRALKIFYASQIDVAPPVFAIFVNHKKHFSRNIRSFLENQMRREYGLEGVPLRIVPRERNESKEGAQ